jgi:hypothetical protein
MKPLISIRSIRKEILLFKKVFSFFFNDNHIGYAENRIKGISSLAKDGAYV